MKTLALVFVYSVVLISHQAGYGNSNSVPGREQKEEMKKRYAPVTITINRPFPNVDITSYVVITDDVEARRKDTEVIMRLKAEFPLAVQTKDAALFDRILARSFTFRAEDQFWQREEYIRNRVERPEMVESPRYENLVLQFFGDTAVLTYRNIVDVQHESGKRQTLHMSWADVYIKEAGEWKIGAAHLIEMK
jgi:ketosteroid isomerase-like protein